MKNQNGQKSTIQAGQDFHIRHQSPVRHNLINLLAICLLGCSIVGPVIASLYVHWMWYPVLGILLGSAFFGYFILIIHEASHNMLFLSSSSTTRKNLNRRIGTIAAVPFFTEYIRHWQEGHVTHHVRPCEHDDPQNPDPLYGTPLLKTIAKVWLIPFGFMPVNPSAKYDRKLKRMTLGTLCWIPVVVLHLDAQPSFTERTLHRLRHLATLNLYVKSRKNMALDWHMNHFQFCDLERISIHCNGCSHRSIFIIIMSTTPTLMCHGIYYPTTIKSSVNYPVDLRHHFIHREYWDQMMGTKALPQWSPQKQPPSLSNYRYNWSQVGQSHHHTAL